MPTTFPQVPRYSGQRLRWPAGLTHIQPLQRPAAPPQPRAGVPS